MQNIKIAWDRQAGAALSEYITYIKDSAPNNADKVKEDILDAIRLLLVHPEMHPPDKYRANNFENQYRAFEKHRLRISYRYYDYTIRIVRVRHTSRNPQSY